MKTNFEQTKSLVNLSVIDRLTPFQAQGHVYLTARLRSLLYIWFDMP